MNRATTSSNGRPTHRLGDRALLDDGRLARAVTASSNVLVDGRRLVRVSDRSVSEDGQVATKNWTGAARVLINQKPASRVRDAVADARRGAVIVGSATVLIGDFDCASARGRSKLEIRIVHEGGIPAAAEEYDVLDLDGKVILSGRTDDDGCIRHQDVQSCLHVIRLRSGWQLRPGGRPPR